MAVTTRAAGIGAGFAALASATLLGVAAPAGAAACSDEFTGPSGGAWSAASNWSAGIPGPATIACWEESKTVVVAEGAQNADSIASGGTVVVLGDGRLDLTGVGSDSSTLGGQIQTSGAGVLEVHGKLASASTVMDGGEVLVDGSIESPVTIAGGTLSGTGSVAGLVSNEGGTVEPGDGTVPGGLGVASYTQGPGGTLRVREDSADAGLSDHLLRVSGPVSLDGTISLSPASPPAGFLLMESATEPQGYFTHVIGPGPGSPWTIAYGANGAIAISGGSVALARQVTGAMQAGGTLTCGLGSREPGPLWEPRGPLQYSWRNVLFTVERATSSSLSSPGPERLAEQLDAELGRDLAANLTVPGTAVGRQISCSIVMWTPASSASSVVTTGESRPVTIGGPYRNTQAPAIAGRPVPGSRLTCSPGRWEGAPDSYTYTWSREGAAIATTASHTVGEADGGKSLTCTVSAHYGSIAVPAEAQVEVPARPQPTLCPRRPVTLVSARPAAGSVLLFGAAVQRHFGQPVVALRRSAASSAWRPVAAGRVNGSGYFELRVPGRAGGSAGSYRVMIGTTPSNVVQVPGLLQIASDSSRPGSSVVDLRLSAAAHAGAGVTVSSLDGCNPGSRLVAARLTPGAELSVRLTAARGSGPAYFLARTTVAGRGYSVELIVPALPPRRVLLG
ncbi:MAG: hypothetical protein ACLQBB_01870 [Solirubrobacteraceae bacterium]